MVEKPVVIGIMGGSQSSRIDIAKRFAEHCKDAGKNADIVVVMRPPSVFVSDGWAANDISLRIVLYQEQSRWRELFDSMSDDRIPVLVSIDLPYSIMAEAMLENVEAASNARSSMLVGADGNPLSRDALTAAQFAGSVMYMSGLIPVVCGPHGEFYNGGIWLLATDEEPASVSEMIVGKDPKTGSPVTQKMPVGSRSQRQRFYESVVLDGFEIPRRDLPQDAEEASKILFDTVLSAL